MRLERAIPAKQGRISGLREVKRRKTQIAPHEPQSGELTNKDRLNRFRSATVTNADIKAAAEMSRPLGYRSYRDRHRLNRQKVRIRLYLHYDGIAKALVFHSEDTSDQPS